MLQMTNMRLAALMAIGLVGGTGIALCRLKHGVLKRPKPSARRLPRRLGPGAPAALLAVLAVFSWAAPARCADNGTEFGVEDTLKIMGTAGTVPDPNVAVKGFSVFGSTNLITHISTAPGNVVINGALEVSSDVYITGRSTFTGNAYFGSTITASAITASSMTVGRIGGLSAPVSGDEPATKAYVDASLLDQCALGSAAPGDIIAGKSADINCDNFAEVGTLAAQTLSVSTDEVKTGVYAATWLSAVDTDLAAGNIRAGYDIFGHAGSFTAAATATAGDILNGLTAGVNGTMITGTLATRTLDPANDTVLAGYYAATTLSAVDTDLGAGNIAVGKTIFGFAGSYTNDATATAAQILASQTAYVNGVKLTGTMATRTLDPANDTVLAGYYAATTLSAVDADLAVGNIKSGVTIFGKTGTFTGGAVPDTGQPASYTATFGEDHDYQPAGTQMSYTVNADNTVTDNRTGLMWRRCSQGKNDDATCTGTAGTYTWENALAQCEGETADYTDWRLPNAKELFSLMKFDGDAPFIDQTTFPATVSNYYWTGTTYVPNTASVMYVNFNSGIVHSLNKTNGYYVRCVRAGP